MKVSLEKKIFFGFIINILIAIAFGWVSYKRVQGQKDMLRLDDDHNKVLLSLSMSLSILNNNDSYAKAYVITGEQKYIERIKRGRYAVQTELDAVKIQMAGKPVQKKRLDALLALVNKKFLDTDQYIELRKYKSFGAASDFIRHEGGAAIQSDIVKMVNLVTETENLEFRKINDQTNKLERVFRALFGILFFGLLILLFVVYFIIRQQLAARKESGQLLEANSQLMQSILDNANNIIFIKKLNGQYMLVNKEVENLFNLSKDQVIGKTDNDIFPKEIADSLTSGDIDVIKDKKEVKFEGKVVLKGEPHNYIFVKFPVWDPQKNLYAIGGIATDITERSRTDLSIKESEEEGRITFDSAPDAIVVINEEGKIIKWNNKCEVLFGWKAAEVMGKPMHEMIMPVKYRDKHLKGFSHFLETGEGPILNKTIEITAINKANVEFDIDLNVSPARVKDKYIFIAFIRDITERKMLQKKVEDSKKFLYSIIENIPSIIFIKDADNLRYTLINKAAEAQFGYDRNEVIGKTVYEIDPKEQADLDASQDKELLTKGGQLNIPEELSETKSGKTWLHTKKILIKDEAGKPAYVLEISENITEQKLLEEKKKETEKLLQQNVQRVKLILENIGEGVIVVDKYGEIILTNHMAAEIVGIREDDTVYTPVDWAKEFDLFYPNEDTIFPAQFLPLEKALLRGESTDNLELIIQDPVTKKRKHVIVNGRPILDENNQVIAAVTTLKDITRFTQLQESLKTSETKYRDLIGFKIAGSKKPSDEKK